MLIALLSNPIQVADYQTLFPYTSFTDSGPSPEWLVENNCAPVSVWLPYDPATQVLQSVDPYLMEGLVYTVSVLDLSDGEIADKQTAALQAQRQAMNVTPFQAKAALLNAGLLDDIEALMADPATDRTVVLAWNNVTEFRRLSPMVAGIASALGWTDEQLDALFVAAAAIEV